MRSTARRRRRIYLSLTSGQQSACFHPTSPSIIIIVANIASQTKLNTATIHNTFIDLVDR